MGLATTTGGWHDSLSPHGFICDGDTHGSDHESNKAIRASLFHGLALFDRSIDVPCTLPRLKSLSNLTSIDVTGASVPLSNHVKLIGVTLDSLLNFNRHISNVCSSSYFHIRALRHIRPYLDSETSRTIACAIFGSRLDYANSVLSGISSRNIHHLQRVQNSLA